MNEQYVTVSELKSLSSEYEVYDIEKKAWVNINDSCYMVQGRGFADPWDTFNRITAITIYKSYDKKNYTLVMKPDLPKDHPDFISYDEADRIANSFENTILYDSEEDMLNGFFELIQGNKKKGISEVDLLVGWNCLPKNTNIFMENKIVKLSDVSPKMVLSNGKKIIHKSGLMTKKKYDIILSNGKIISSSNDHIFPLLSKNKTSYNNLNSLKKSLSDIRVKNINTDEKDYFMKIELHNNTNRDLTFKNLIVNNFNNFYNLDSFDIIVTSEENINKVRNSSLITEKWKINRYCKNTLKFPSIMSVKNLIEKNILTLDDIKYELENDFYVKIKNSKKCLLIDNTIIDSDIFYLLGILFTDGSLYKNTLNFYNTNIGIIEKLCGITKNTFNAGRDGCSRVRTNNPLYRLFLLFVYDENNQKHIDVNLFSQLSTGQFSSFFSGMIDGDGSVYKKSIELCNFNNCCDDINTLLLWNGVYSTMNSNNANIRIPLHQANKKFIESLNIFHTVKKQNKFYNNYFVISETNSQKNIKMKYCSLDNSYYIKIKEIKETDEYIEMIDIEVEDQYFNANGIKTHNSAYYDIPYMINRIKDVMGKEHTKKFCLWDQFPKIKEGKDKWGKPTKTYETFGIVHLDFLDVYKKNNGKELPSFSLDYVSELELGDKKVAYEGTLDDLYKKDFYKFIEYSRQDVMLMVRIEEKKKYLALCNQLAHMNTVTIPKSLGSVAIIEQGITNRVHQRGMVVPNKKTKDFNIDDDYAESGDSEINEEEIVVGAYVREPVPGVYKMVACMDINSLYPSAIRSLNLGTETLIGQIRPTKTDKWVSERLSSGIKAKDVWVGTFACKEYDLVMNKSEELIDIDYEDGTVETMPAKELYKIIFEDRCPLILSANGTLFRSDVEGVIPEILGVWYSERQSMQKEEKNWRSVVDGIKIPEGFLD